LARQIRQPQCIHAVVAFIALKSAAFLFSLHPTCSPDPAIKPFIRRKGDLMTDTTRPDEGLRKGAVEDDAPVPDNERRPEHGSLSGQLGHRDQDDLLKNADTDFPEPDAEGEHTGE
jgi:hypothetical protein